MAFYASQALQPFEEHQSPSPTDELAENPYELALTPRRTSSLHPRAKSINSGPPSPVNSLHSRLSGDPESPPPAWKRRSTISGRHPNASASSTPSSASKPVAPQPAAPHAAAPESPGHSTNPSTSSVITASSIPARILPPSSRRHPSLAMTAAATARAPVTPNSLEPSPHGSSTSLGDNLALPNPAFIRRRGGDGSASSSPRSSIASSQDLSTLTSEELWTLNRDDVPDMSNPHTVAAERPLDTVRRQNKYSEAPNVFHGGLPGEVIWPSAPPVDDFAPPPRTKSHTSINTLGKKRMSIRRNSRRTSDASPVKPKAGVQGIQSMPVSPVAPKQAMMSSAHSSSTSLSSHQAISSNKSFPALNAKAGAPPTTYYSRDFLSSLAPREGGYAIAAQLGGGLGAAGTMTAADNKRRSSYAEQGGRARAPVARSTGMGRWSLDGGENYGRPYMTASASTTASNLSAPPLTSNPSNNSSIEAPRMPEGAMPAISTPHGAASVSPAPAPAPAQPQRASPNPSPLSQQTSAEQIIPSTPEAPVAPNAPQVADAPVTKQVDAPAPSASAPTKALAPAPVVTDKKSKRQIAKETKAAQKAEQQAAAQAAARAKAEQMRTELAKKQKAREDEQKRKDDAKRQEKEEKARRKAEKKDKKNGLSKKTAAVEDLKQKPVQATPAKAAPAKAASDFTPSSVAAASTSATPARASSAIPSTPTTLRSAVNVDTPESGVPESTRPSRSSMPAGRMLSGEQAPATEKRPEVKLRRSFFGTLRKRLSSNTVERVDRDTSPVPPMPNGAAAQTQAQAQAQDGFISPPPRRTSLMAINRGAVSSRSPAPSSEPVAEESPADSPATVRPNAASALADAAPSSPSPSPSRNSHQIPRKPVSPEGSINGRRSVSGPRPMPAEVSRSRATSLAALSAEQGEVAAPVTPSTSGDDSQLSFTQSRSSHKSDVTPVTSLSGSEAMSEDGSRYKDSTGVPVLGGEVQPAEKQSSKDSDETLLPHQAPAVNASVLA
ncbi:hypothetical protein IAR50_002739 [Cryptococcus sp. DSM 104548]